ncbi:hypothetical protein I553_3724 [Mycobacterium xenopi 4042]|uniref:Uncharacterized protein n=1 Tax=Mycobacterium xenopi 4042 TaxID=1299334 RepID=X7YTC1_MYCXE|nr:hypothetical protein I553_3724 [Mycobacterium xenopi 4042]
MSLLIARLNGGGVPAQGSDLGVDHREVPDLLPPMFALIFDSLPCARVWAVDNG